MRGYSLSGIFLALGILVLLPLIFDWIQIHHIIGPLIALVIGSVWSIYHDKTREKATSDERTKSIGNKSAMNALYAIYLSFIITLLVTQSKDVIRIWLVFIVGSGLLTYVISYLYFNYRES